MLQIKNTLGGGKPEGLYAWKKCVGTGVVKETPSTKKYYFTTSQSESATIYYSSSYTYDNGDFVLTNPSEINIGLGANNAIEADLYFMANTSRGNVMLKSSSGSNNQRTVIFNLKSGLYAHCPDLSYPFYICNDTYEFLDYIVSDKETAYPDGGEKNGYWYERVRVVDLVKIGCTKFEEGSVVLSSDSSSMSLNHSLDVVPKFGLLYTDELPNSGTYVKNMSRVIRPSDGYDGYALFYGNASNGEYIYDYQGSGYKWTTTTAYFSCISSLKFKSGITYNYVIFG